MPTWNLPVFLSEVEDAGYQVDVLLNEKVTIEFLKTGLAAYDLIILRTDSFVLGGNTYYCSGEPTSFETRVRLANEIASQEVRVGVCVGFSAIFLHNSYPEDTLQPGLVYAVGSGTAELAWAFLGAGSAVFAGYYEDWSLSWGRMDSLSIKLFHYLGLGYSVKDAMIQLDGYMHRGHGNTANWPSLFWAGNGNIGI